MQDLRTLNLADNSLVDVTTKIFQMLTKLKTLDLSRNPLEDLPPDVFKDIIVSWLIFQEFFIFFWINTGSKSAEMSWMSIAEHQPTAL